jgi:hypothetical protein
MPTLSDLLILAFYQLCTCITSTTSTLTAPHSKNGPRLTYVGHCLAGDTTLPMLAHSYFLCSMVDPHNHPQSSRPFSDHATNDFNSVCDLRLLNKSMLDLIPVLVLCLVLLSHIGRPHQLSAIMRARAYGSELFWQVVLWRGRSGSMSHVSAEFCRSSHSLINLYRQSPNSRTKHGRSPGA